MPRVAAPLLVAERVVSTWLLESRDDRYERARETQRTIRITTTAGLQVNSFSQTMIGPERPGIQEI